MSAAKRPRSSNLSWVHPLESGAGPRYMQIARQIAGAVEGGVLRPGDRLPPQRELAQLLKVDLTTVTRAYSEIRLLGLLDAQGSGGSYITSRISTVEPADGAIDVSMNAPPLLAGPLPVRLQRAASTHVAYRASEDVLMSYQVGAGTKADRDAGALWLKPMLGRVDGQQIIVCPGAQSALAALLLTQTREGDTVVAEPLTYPGFLAAARLFRRNVAPVVSDAQGMRPDALEAACIKHRPGLIYLTPTIKNPTATTMTEQRRRDIYAIATRYGVGIVEDDPYWLLAGDAPPPIATLMGRSRGSPVFYISTLSKCLSPGLRTAYLVMPPSRPIAPVLDALRCMVLMPAGWMTAMATQWIQSGGALKLLGAIREELAARQHLAASILPEAAVGHPYGLHRWLPLPSSWDQFRLVQFAREQGLDVTASYAFAVSETVPNAVRISLGGAVERVVLDAGLRRLAAMWSDSAPQRSFNVM
ncbi:DNA-binding transcriptional regulator, MocR family, contains an aminotransferase domain [Cupriavidus sp. YR651]|uniref:aminotransferase-like domain-containing protein n=1 Tax=Cupriavidus sp. YR651 TaxID=1855315 RepID=UPI00088D6D6B|nr:PLP-dependent aminotransferase family protein [Cupriavidus sp. YR651]SDD96232.1 DNA-binding transcriptional regulator, MocR family, contains an aminotransferase domain [Cupriavidus sp. YR651]